MLKPGRLACVWMLLVAVACGRDIHVDNLAGDDSFAGERVHNRADASGPVRTITRALQLAGTGDRIVLANTGEPYRESISLVGSQHSGYPRQPFTILGNGAILDGSAPVPAGAWEHYGGSVFRFRPPRGGQQQLFINDLPAVRVAVSGLAGGPPKLEPLQWCLVGGEIYFCVQPDKLPADYPLSYAAKQTGITLFHVHQVAILDLTVQGFQVDGISAYNSARDVYLAGVTCRGNARNGLTIGGASTVWIDACLVGNNGQAQLLTLPWSRTDIRNSDLLSNTAPAWIDQGGRVYIDGRPMEGGSDGQDIRAPEAARQ